jgi:hypothetical protein
MAWIKLETHTFDKVEVFSMAQELGIDPDSVVGKCCRVWAWFDANTTDGITKSVTTALLDRYCGVTGFSQAMVNVGWMVIEDGDLFLPNYDRHNSQTAKDRALNAKRVAKSKKKALDNAEGNGVGNGNGNGESLPKSLDREEKRREDIKAPKGTRFTLDAVPEEWILFCRKERSDLNPTVVFEGFKDYWVSVAGAKGVKLDWFATWRNWIRNQKGAVQQVEKVKFI